MTKPRKKFKKPGNTTCISFNPNTGEVNGEDAGDGKVKKPKRVKKRFVMGEGILWHDGSRIELEAEPDGALIPLRGLQYDGKRVRLICEVLE